ncbi:MAG: LysM peptidoglycan-binding domain-containing protein [Treponema sp.]|jgi:murein DD-endopeptidase MepM/ murein hydrolase activator NlpD|nr:LysM peptidoglycan-binding domain-containing protein [Treponema sp.]
MIYRFLTLGLAFALAAPAFGEEGVYLVRKGETLYSIARTVGIQYGELMEFNGIHDPTQLRAGQRLKIPGPGGIERAEGSANTQMAGLKTTQELTKPEEPQVGVQKKADDPSYSYYKVMTGDSLYRIAQKLGVSLDALIRVNALTDTYVLRVGDMLKIPPKIEQPAPQSVPPQSAAPKNTAPAAQSAAHAPQKALSSAVKWPVLVKELSRMTGKLNGVVLTGSKAEPVKSINSGTVVRSGPYRGFGKVVIVEGKGGYLYVYGGCESLAVKAGDKVVPGMELGKLGLDAVSAKPQLFFLVYRGDTAIDPEKAPRT